MGLQGVPLNVIHQSLTVSYQAPCSLVWSHSRESIFSPSIDALFYITTLPLALCQGGVTIEQEGQRLLSMDTENPMVKPHPNNHLSLAF